MFVFVAELRIQISREIIKICRCGFQEMKDKPVPASPGFSIYFCDLGPIQPKKRRQTFPLYFRIFLRSFCHIVFYHLAFCALTLLTFSILFTQPCNIQHSVHLSCVFLRMCFLYIVAKISQTPLLQLTLFFQEMFIMS